MSKKFGKLSKKRMFTIIIISSLTIFALGGVGYYFYMQNQRQQQTETKKQEKAIDVERKKLDEASFRGDRDLAAQYGEKASGGELDAAYGVYATAASKASDDAEKATLYEQAITVASRANQIDQAIRFSVLLTQVSDSHRASSNAANLYAEKKDIINQKKYLQQAMDRLENLPKDSEEYSSFKAYYQAQLTQIGVN
jgi:tetratricopeptide (TPR) repeat protein